MEDKDLTTKQYYLLIIITVILTVGGLVLVYEGTKSLPQSQSLYPTFPPNSFNRTSITSKSCTTLIYSTIINANEKAHFITSWCN